MKIEKIIKKLPTGFAEDAAAFDEGQIKDHVLQSEANIRRVEQERDADEKLAGAKEILKDLNEPYRDAINRQRAKIAYLMHLLDERGKLFTP